MELQTTKPIKITDIDSGTFKNDDGESIAWARLQHVDIAPQKVGDDWIEMPSVQYLSCTPEIAIEVEKNKSYHFIIAAKIKRNGTSTTIKHSVIKVLTIK